MANNVHTVCWKMLMHALMFVAAFVAAARQDPPLPPTQYGRETRLPPMAASRAEVERLFTTIIEEAPPLPPLAIGVTGKPMTQVMGTATNGRVVAVTLWDGTALDTLRKYLDPRSGLERFVLSFTDTRGYSAPWAPRISSVSVSLSSVPGSLYAGYSVRGSDRAAVDSIADRIEAFAARHRTWRDPHYAELSKKALQLLALMMLPMALALRDRRFVWLLVPLSLALLATAYLVPFDTYFQSVTMFGPS